MSTLLKNNNRIWRQLVIAGITAIVAFGTYSCDDMVNVTDPDIVTPESLSGQEGLETLRAGSLGDLAVAMSGSAAGHGATPGLVTMSALMTDEYIYTGTFPTRREADTRNVQNTNGTMDGIYGNMHRARAAAERAAELAAEIGGLTAIESEMQNVAGYSYVMFAETYCPGVPFSKAPADGGDLEFGEPLTTEQMFTRAADWFDEALNSAGTANTQMANLARIGKARALLGLGQISDAANIVQSVPTDFVYNIEHSDNSRRQENGIYIMSTVRQQWSIAEGKGGNGLMFRSANDPRTPWEDNDEIGQDDITKYYNQLKYPSSSAPVVLASGIEARLIEAEAAVQATDNQAVEDIHNNLRALEGLPADDLSGMDQDELSEYHFKERAFWLFSTGHRQGDLRRLVRVYGKDAANVFPWGTYFKGGQYEPVLSFPVPQSEENNPNFQGCLDEQDT
ncbi:MAG: hypothetical protein JJ892_09915 [Balneola sp.]|jgi:hypothetical protein|nr:hypothetical protein [Balneola sp.]MBO6649486.1 hypothetical protein [Balneola sp.]MBO6711302.1 hypothetical protein [Balneola sp.]MBO6800583.1 hypothetical protein [Balneola sp.]MBO6869238.1 hypothetical protein [Balneola sp.]